jgi:hypothetical protein
VVDNGKGVEWSSKLFWKWHWKWSITTKGVIDGTNKVREANRKSQQWGNDNEGWLGNFDMLNKKIIKTSGIALREFRFIIYDL